MRTAPLRHAAAALALALSLSPGTLGRAEAEAKPAAVELDARGLLEHVRQAQAELSSLKARFTETRRFVAFDEEETRQGWFYLKRGVGVRLEFDPPADEIVVVGGGRAEVFNPRTKQLNRIIFPEGTRGEQFLLGFLGDSELTDGQPSRFTRLAPEAGLERLAIAAAAGETDAVYQDKTVSVDPTDWLPRRIVLRELTDDLLSFSFSELDRTARLADGLFQLAVPDGTEIIEHHQSSLKF